jgi:septal ring factor EnvC (AmiA/AmiB activator)
LVVWATDQIPSLSADVSDQKQLDRLKIEISSLQKQLRGTNDKRSKAAKELREVETKAAVIRRTLQNLNLRITDLNTKLANLEQRHRKLAIVRQQQATLVANEISAAYRLGKQESLKLLLNLNDASKISRMLKYYEYIVKARTAVLVNYSNTISDIASTEQSLLDNKLILDHELAEYSAASAKLNVRIQDRKVVLSKINSQLHGDRSRLEKLQLEKSQLNKIIARLEENIRDLVIPNEGPFINQKGKLPWPVKGRIRHGFGATRTANLKWTGWFLSAKEESPVSAVHHGRVVFSDYLRGHGLLLIIDHGGGYLSLYAHNQVLLKETGDWVLSGEDIAKVGNTGGLEHSALYFELRKRGKAIDPKPWLKTRV